MIGAKEATPEQQQRILCWGGHPTSCQAAFSFHTWACLLPAPSLADLGSQPVP